MREKEETVSCRLRAERGVSIAVSISGGQKGWFYESRRPERISNAGENVSGYAMGERSPAREAWEENLTFHRGIVSGERSSC